MNVLWYIEPKGIYVICHKIYALVKKNAKKKTCTGKLTNRCLCNQSSLNVTEKVSDLDFVNYNLVYCYPLYLHFWEYFLMELDIENVSYLVRLTKNSWFLSELWLRLVISLMPLFLLCRWWAARLTINPYKIWIWIYEEL